MDKSKSTEEGKLMFMERLSPPAQSETYKSVSEQLQQGLYDLCDNYHIAMPYRNGACSSTGRTPR